MLGPGLISGGQAPSTSSSSALFAQPLFQGLPKLPDDSPEEVYRAAPGQTLASALLGDGEATGGKSASSLGGGAGLVFGPLGGGQEADDPAILSKATATSSSLRAG